MQWRFLENANLNFNATFKGVSMSAIAHQPAAAAATRPSAISTGRSAANRIGLLTPGHTPPPSPTKIDDVGRRAVNRAIEDGLQALRAITDNIKVNKEDAELLRIVQVRMPSINKQIEACAADIPAKAAHAKIQQSNLPDIDDILNDPEEYAKLLRMIPQAVNSSYEGESHLASACADILEEWFQTLLFELEREPRTESISDLFKRYKFTSLRTFLWNLSKVSAIHCKTAKEKCLSLLIKCFDKDPIDEESIQDLPQAINNIVNYLHTLFCSHSPSSPTPGTATTNSSPQHNNEIDSKMTLEGITPRILSKYLRLLAAVSETWLHQYVDRNVIAIQEFVRGQLEQILKAVDRLNTNSNHDVQLYSLVAREAIKNFTSDKTKFDKFLEIASGIAKGVNDLVSRKDFKSIAQGTWQIVTTLYDSYKLLQEKWYGELIAVKLVFRKTIGRADQMRLVESHLAREMNGITHWGLASSLIHIMGTLARESPSTVKYQALLGQQVVEFNAKGGGSPKEIPGFFHFRHPRILSGVGNLDRAAVLFGVANKTDVPSKLEYLAKITNEYATDTLAMLPILRSFNPNAVFGPIFKEAYSKEGNSAWDKATVETDAMREYYESLARPLVDRSDSPPPLVPTAAAAANAAGAAALGIVSAAAVPPSDQHKGGERKSNQAGAAAPSTHH